MGAITQLGSNDHRHYLSTILVRPSCPNSPKILFGPNTSSSELELSYLAEYNTIDPWIIISTKPEDSMICKAFWSPAGRYLYGLGGAQKLKKVITFDTLFLNICSKHSL